MIGERLGPYRIESELGSGGMGRVYAAVVEGRCRGLDEGTRVALKIVHPHLLETPGFFKRFVREGEIGRAVRHDNVVRTLEADALVHDGVQHNFLVMEYVEGQTLRELLVELDRVPEELCRHIGREVAKGLAAIHEAGAVHRDMKPDNVLITQDHVVKVMDLGVARLQDEALRLSQTGAFVGSLHYAAPEQFGGGAGMDHRADLHALGLVLYELSCGQHPYYDESVRVVMKRLLNEEPRRVAEINPQLSPFFEELVHTLLAKERDERFASAAEVAAILEAGESSAWWEGRAKALRVETKQPLRRVRIVRETALYGRDAELSKLHTLFDRVKAGDGQVLLVEGEAGIGKTRLVDEFVGRLRQDGEDLNFLFGSYPPGGAATAAGAFSTAYREQFGEIGLADTLRAYLTTTPVLIPAFAALLAGDATPAGQEPLTKDSLQTVFVHATRALAAERPTLILIDDLHFAPDEGRALFAALATAVAEHGVLLVGTTRPGLAKDWVADVERLEHSSRMSVERLYPKDLIRLLQDSLRSERLAEQLAGRIAVKSDGNPFFVFEIVRGLREGQFITQSEDGSWVTTRVIDEIQIPSSVLELVNARVADLEEEQRDLLDVAACWGFEFDATLVGDALGLRRIPALKHFARIEKAHRLVRCAGERFVFDHHQIQEALYGALPPQLGREYHAALAEALETREQAASSDPKDLGGPLCVDLCEHYFKGARGDSAVRYLGAALDHLVASYLNDPAIELAALALSVPGLVAGTDRVEILLRQAERLDYLGRREAERAALDEALALAESLSPADGALHARVETSLGWHLLLVARYDEAYEVLSRALDRAREVGDTEVEAQATGNRGTVCLHTGRYEEAREHYERRLALGIEMGDRRMEAHATGNLGAVAWSQARYAESREQFERYLAISREIGNRPGEASATGNLGNLLLSQGRYGKARENYERSLQLAREIGERQAEASNLGNLGLVFATLGRPGVAREQLHESMAICREIGERRLEGGALEGLAAAAESLGEYDAAERFHREALGLYREIGRPQGIAYSLKGLGVLLANVQRAEEAVAVLTEAADTAQEAGIPGAGLIARCRLALLPGGDADGARAALDESGAGLLLLERMEARFLLWRAQHDPADLAEAHRLLSFLRDHAPDDCRDTLLENVPLHRDIAAAWAEHGASG